MRKRAWRKKYELPPGYIQEELFQEQEQLKPSILKIFFRFVSIIAVIALLTGYLTLQIFQMNLNHDIAALEKDLEIIHRDNESLRLQYTQAENLDYVEKIAINKLGMVRPRRVIYLKNMELASSMTGLEQ